MGLDMFIYRCSKPRLSKDRVYDSYDLDGIVLSPEEIDSQMFKDLKPYCVEVRVMNHYYDMEKIRKDFDLSDKASIWRISGSGVTV